jgi:SAM-dependent MidA family methyltransferase
VEAAARHDALVALLRREARAGVVPFSRLVEAALYAPGLGYYVAERARVGKAAGTDFTTAAALGPMFGELVAAAAGQLVGDLAAHALVEVGAEPGQTHFTGVAGRFAAHHVFRVGATPRLPARSVLVANELFDAQPFDRFIFQGGAWRELGVRVDGPTLTPEVLPAFTDPAAPAFVAGLPAAEEGWIIDVPFAAERLLAQLAAGGWTGAVIFLDYGKTVAQCLESSPAGTARAYYRHQLSGDILTRLGSQDLTCHVLWDRLEPVLRAAGFRPALDRQEAFFVKHAAGAMERIAASGDPEATGRLRALTHPAHFGSKFQVLHGLRP